jgi:SecD/SecF fusion protein
MSFFNTRAVIYLLLILIGLTSAVPNFLNEHTKSSLPSWFSQNTLKLGLDLQGGSHLLMTADTTPLLEGAVTRASEQFLSQLKENKINYKKPITEAIGWQISLGDSTQLAKARSLAMEHAIAPDGQRMFKITSTGNTLNFLLTQEYIKVITSDALERSLEVVRRRLNETGLIEPSITRQGNDGVLVQMPGVTDPAYIRQLLGTTAQMSFHWVITTATTKPTILVQGTKDQQAYRLEKRVAMKGEHISDVRLGFNPKTGEPLVNFSLDNAGAKLFGEMTRTNIGRPLAIVLDNKVITAPVIRGIIATGSGEISGHFTSDEQIVGQALKIFLETKLAIVVKCGWLSADNAMKTIFSLHSLSMPRLEVIPRE